TAPGALETAPVKKEAYRWKATTPVVQTKEVVATPKALKKALEHEKTPELAAKLAAEAIERDPWAAQVSQLSLPKLVEQVALNAWKEQNGNAVCLHLRSTQRHLNSSGAQQKLAQALSDLTGTTVELTIVEDDNPAVRTPLEWRQAIYEEKLAQARESIIADNNIQTLRRFFDAELDEESIRPI
ncbi:DNA polymerase III subunit gamma/tau, partial [Salmonella enterica subsp. enterica serovar Typhimurium]|nr:DNA polymerase III subunit gamma/tau [Salmonella enterica subsp. enterica serovar Typhimurium]